MEGISRTFRLVRIQTGNNLKSSIKMLINCPLKSSKDVLSLIKEGADSFYFGVNKDLIFGNSIGPLNRRPWKFANFDSLKDVKKAISLVRIKRKKINFVLNEHFYSPDQISKAIKFIRKIYDIDGVIIVDLGLALQIRKKLPQTNLIASTGMHIQNRSAIDFYQRLGINKIILPRHFTLREIENLTKKYRKIDFEVFIMNEDCANIDGLCHYAHGMDDYSQGKMPCHLLSNYSVFFETGVKMKKEEILNNLSEYEKCYFRLCGACHIPFFQKIGIKSVKIVGRSLPVDKIRRDVQFIKFAISKPKSSGNNFRKILQRKFKEIHGFSCDRSCFYDFR